ncbi:hypothetical protein [Fibrella aquatica]|uniref:hypothetical protein n=1 Tax=Fibrella aquatica TaxID=3242487 RepID=UPI003520315A
MAEDSALNSNLKLLEYSFYFFTPDGVGRRLLNGRYSEDNYVLDNAELTLFDDKFSQVVLNRQSLAMLAVRQVNGQNVVLRYKAYRLPMPTDELRFHALARVAFTHPIKSETDEQIKERVKNTLYFYSLFFKAVHRNRFNRFKPAAIYLPIRYYRRGIGVTTSFDSTATWTTLYATEADARKAQQFMRKAAMALKKYPVRENGIQQYALVLEQMADTL